MRQNNNGSLSFALVLFLSKFGIEYFNSFIVFSDGLGGNKIGIDVG